jgi:RNA recognition motif-containing protein
MYQPPAPAAPPPAAAGHSGAGKAPDAAGGDKKKKGQLREAAGQRWRDPTLDEWPKNDFRIFVGDLGNDVNDDVLAKAFQKYPSFAKAKVT